LSQINDKHNEGWNLVERRGESLSDLRKRNNALVADSEDGGSGAKKKSLKDHVRRQFYGSPLKNRRIGDVVKRGLEEGRAKRAPALLLQKATR